MKESFEQINRGQLAVYTIILLGRLGREWSNTFDDFELSVDETENGQVITTMIGMVADQAALHGLLNQIRDLGMVLLRLECAYS